MDRFYSKQLISYAGQNDISNSVWLDTEQFAAKQEPELLLRDLEGRLRNGRVESGRSPFAKQDFLRMDGQAIEPRQLQGSDQNSKSSKR